MLSGLLVEDLILLDDGCHVGVVERSGSFRLFERNGFAFLVFAMLGFDLSEPLLGFGDAGFDFFPLLCVAGLPILVALLENSMLFQVGCSFFCFFFFNEVNHIVLDPHLNVSLGLDFCHLLRRSDFFHFFYSFFLCLASLLEFLFLFLDAIMVIVLMPKVMRLWLLQ